MPWQAHYRWVFRQRFLEPRLTAEYRRLAEAPHPALVAACDALSEHYGIRYDNLWLNLYRGGEDSTGWRRNRFSCRRPECIVPVLTLGATRRFLLKPRAGGPSIALHPSAGDLVVMGGRCQEEWVHSVPKAPGTLGARISVNFQSSEQARRPRPRRHTLIYVVRKTRRAPGSSAGTSASGPLPIRSARPASRSASRASGHCSGFQ